MKKFLFSILCVNLFQASLQQELLLNDDQKQLTSAYLKLQMMEEAISESIQNGIPLTKFELLNIQRYLKKQIRKRKNAKKFLAKILKKDDSANGISK